MSTLSGKVAIVTGASSGIGYATAHALAEQGASIVAAARRMERLETLKKELEEKEVPVEIVQTDVTVRADVERLAQTTKERFGRIDILVNNAGVMLLSPIERCVVDEWEKMIDVNVKGLMFCTSSVLPTMIEQSSGHIINISSIAGRRVFPTGGVYCATKFAVNAFTEGLRSELSPRYNIRVTTIGPGVVATELTDHITDKNVITNFQKMREDLVPLESIDVAEAVVYATTQPQRANINDIVLLPTNQR